MQGSTEASTSKLPAAHEPLLLPKNRVPQSASSSKGKGKAVVAAYSEQSWEDVLLSGLAGGIAGCVAKTSVAPLDRVKILFQTGSQPFEKYSGTWTGMFKAMGQIWRESGVRGLLQGHSATLLRIFPYAGIRFMAYESYHRLLMPTPDSITSSRLFAAGAMSGVTSVLFTYPLELIRVRLAYDKRLPPSELQGRSAIAYSISKIYHEGDPHPLLRPTVTLTEAAQVAASSVMAKQPYFKNPSPFVVLSSSLFQKLPILKFYRGFVVSIIGMVPYAGTSFLVWGYLKKRLRPSAGQQRHPTAFNLACGAVAGAAAQTASYPFEVVRRRMQVGGLLRPDRFFGFWETVQFVYKRNGWKGFFVGLSIGYLKVVPMTAVSFATWEGMKRVFGVDRKRAKV